MEHVKNATLAAPRVGAAKNREGLTMSALSAFGLLARDLRSKRGLTMAEQSDSMKISPSSISRIETGQENATLDYADKFAKWINADLFEHQELRRSAISGKKNQQLRGSECSRLYRRKLNTLTGEEIRQLREIARGKPDAG